MATTLASDLIVPEVWGDAVMESILGKAVLVPLADADDELVGQPGDTIHFPKFDYIGDAVDLTEGVAMDTTKLTMSDATATIKEAGKAIELSDTAVVTAIGRPNDQARTQLALAISRKLDADIRTAAESTVGSSPLSFDGTAGVLSWNTLTNGFAQFGDEYDPAELAGIVVHSKQHIDLMKDSNFVSADKFGANATILRGQVGAVGGVPVFVSDRATVAAGEYNALIIRRGALAVKYKRRPIVEADRDILKRTNIITTNVHYAVKRIDDRGVVVLSSL